MFYVRLPFKLLYANFATKRLLLFVLGMKLKTDTKIDTDRRPNEGTKKKVILLQIGHYKNEGAKKNGQKQKTGQEKTGQIIKTPGFFFGLRFYARFFLPGFLPLVKT